MLKGKSVGILMATYNDWDSILELLPDIDAELTSCRVTGRVVIIDDGSDDIVSREQIASLPLSTIEAVDVVNLYRNHGNQRAIAIGIAHCADKESFDYLLVMDSDHEDKPSDIPRLLEACAVPGNSQIIFAERSKRSEGPVFTFFYVLYKYIYSLLTGTKISVGNFSVIPKNSINRVANISELWSHYPAAIMHAKLKFSHIPSVRGKRKHGRSKMSFVPLVLHALNGFSIHAEFIGIRILIAAFWFFWMVIGLVVLAFVLKGFTDIPILGWTSQIVGLLMIMILQLAIAIMIMVFLIIFARMQIPMIPINAYSNFVMDITRLFPQTIK